MLLQDYLLCEKWTSTHIHVHIYISYAGATGILPYIIGLTIGLLFSENKIET